MDRLWWWRWWPLLDLCRHDVVQAEESAAFPRAAPRHLSEDLRILSALQIWFSSGGSLPVLWDFYVRRYALTVPIEAVAVAIVAQLAAAHGSVDLVLYRIEDGVIETLTPGVPSTFVDVPTEEPTLLVLQLRDGVEESNFTLSIIRSTVSADLHGSQSDLVRNTLPQSTLAGLTIFTSSGDPVRTTPPYFIPQQLQYTAAVEMTTAWIGLVASSNDPDATILARANGDEWQTLEAGRNSHDIAVPERGWLLLEIKVESPTSADAGYSPLVYSLLLSRDAQCHERCSRCTGPGEGDCLACRQPLVLSNGYCDSSACPVDGFYSWKGARCQHCDTSCAQCNSPEADVCTLCPALHFLAPQTWLEDTGPCAIECPQNQFAHPPSRRCRVPPVAPVKAFYMSFLFRLRYDASHSDARLLESVHNTTSFVLGVSLSDAHVYRVEEAGNLLRLTLEIVSPFLTRSEASRILIDSWFGAFEVPVDVVSTLTWDEVHPPELPPPVMPFLPLWAWGLMASVASGIIISVLAYCFYFRRLKNIKRKYALRRMIDDHFIDKIVKESPPWLISRFIRLEAGSRHLQRPAQIKDGRTDAAK